MDSALLRAGAVKVAPIVLVALLAAVAFLTAPKRLTEPFFSFGKSDIVSLVPQQEPAPYRFLFLGDMMLDRNVAKQLTRTPFREMMKDFRAAGKFDDYDLVIANLEGPFVEKRVPTKKEIAFRFDPKLAPDLKWLGIDVVSLANNHALDMGRAALVRTREILKQQNIPFFGDSLNANVDSTVVLTVREKRVAFVGFNTTFRTMKLPDMARTVREAKAKADVVFVYMHWGDEYKPIHNREQELHAHALVDAGADAVIGAHPHVVQDTEIYKGKPIAYSLGNFLFDQYFSKETQQGLAAEIAIDATGSVKLITRKFHAVKSKPVWD